LLDLGGAGKSTLLDVLAQRKTTGEISGEILYNGSTVLRSTAYVMQDNVHIGLLTVRESLYFAAQLRLPEEWPIEKKEKRVDKILDMLGLTEVANTLVGNHSIRGISGGQTKRLSIGVEIINLPNIMFLDEPTTGLDSSISLEVMSAVRNLANQNRTVICTIHQPSHATFELFDTLLLLAKGRVIYFGNVNEVIEYFMHSSPYHFHYKAGTNPADYVIAVAGSFLPASDGRHIPGDELAEYYVKQRSANPKFVIDPRKNPIFESGTLPAVANFQLNHSVSQAQIDSQEELALEEKKYITSTSHQMKILSHRAFIKTARDRKATVAATGR
jgi:ABC-type multidrug transport system ATPase subunit